MQNGVMSFQEFTHAPTRSVMNQMTTNFHNFIGPLRVEFPISTCVLKKGLKYLRQVQRITFEAKNDF